MIHDEHSMLAGAMNHAASLLATYAREAKFRLRREDYALPRERYGRMAALAYFGDHLQLPPIPKKTPCSHHWKVSRKSIESEQRSFDKCTTCFTWRR